MDKLLEKYKLTEEDLLTYATIEELEILFEDLIKEGLQEINFILGKIIMNEALYQGLVGMYPFLAKVVKDKTQIMKALMKYKGRYLLGVERELKDLFHGKSKPLPPPSQKDLYQGVAPSERGEL